ncbi:MAG: hypothetical protein ACJ788_05795 [Ktedonobacteraceae bacterium]
MKTNAHRHTSRPRIIEMEPEDLVVYVHRAEKEVLRIIKDMQLSPGAAQFLLAQYTQALVTGDPHFTLESVMKVANTILALWQAGFYTPSPAYPYTLEETLKEIQEGPKAKEDYARSFQPFTPTKKSTPRGLGKVATGIVKHPETHLWQIWMIVDGPCAYFGAYRDPAGAQAGLEELITASRRGATQTEGLALYQKLSTQGDGEPKQLPYDMMVYLIDHLHLYRIQL